MLLLFISAVYAQSQCLSLQGSEQCPEFQTSYVNQANFPSIRVFDEYVESIMMDTYYGSRKFKNEMVCPGFHSQQVPFLKQSLCATFIDQATSINQCQQSQMQLCSSSSDTTQNAINDILLNRNKCTQMQRGHISSVYNSLRYFVSKQRSVTSKCILGRNAKQCGLRSPRSAARYCFAFPKDACCSSSQRQPSITSIPISSSTVVNPHGFPTPNPSSTQTVINPPRSPTSNPSSSPTVINPHGSPLPNVPPGSTELPKGSPHPNPGSNPNGFPHSNPGSNPNGSPHSNPGSTSNGSPHSNSQPKSTEVNSNGFQRDPGLPSLTFWPSIHSLPTGFSPDNAFPFFSAPGSTQFSAAGSKPTPNQSQSQPSARSNPSAASNILDAASAVRGMLATQSSLTVHSTLLLSTATATPGIPVSAATTQGSSSGVSAVVLGICIGAAVLLLIFAWLLFYIRKRRKNDDLPIITPFKGHAEDAASIPARVIFEHIPQLSDEIRLVLHDSVLVQSKFDDGWAYGVNISSGDQGNFPLACVAALDVPEVSKLEGSWKPGKRGSSHHNADMARYTVSDYQ